MFDRRRWLSCVRAVRELDGVADAIGPFGFELLAESEYSIRLPRRFFIYVALLNGVDTEGVAAQLARFALSPAFAGVFEGLGGVGDVVVSGVRQGKGEGAAQIHFYLLSGVDDLLGDYGRHLAGIALAARGGLWAEWDHYDEKPSARRYVMHTGLLQARLYPTLAPLLDWEQRLLSSTAREQEVSRGSDGRGALRPASRAELQLREEVLIPYFAQIEEHLAPTAVDTRWLDIHTNTSGTIRASAEKIAAAVTVVRRGYLSFGAQRESEWA